ncbi:MAG: YidC/Oxa1 family membrane protein insertase, partial [Oscillospiraceae bacterium]|nr:YidC/Oxa1 family membrane protein insertase [Oscillospiraceae bacterium]
VAAPLFEGNSYFNQRPELYILQAVKDNPSMFENIQGVPADILQKIYEFDNMLFGVVDLGVIPKSVFDGGITWNASSIGLIAIPVISGIVQLAMTFYSTAKQKKLNPEASAQMGSMNTMLYIMPFFSVWIAFSYPAGIGFYWVCSSIVGFIQTFILNKIFTPEYVAKLIEKDKLKNKNKKRSAFMEQYNQMLKDQLNQQQNSQGSRQQVRSEDGEEIKLSKSQMKEYERKIIAEARRRQAEKYGDEYIEDDND